MTATPVLHAATDDGLNLPVVVVTHPAFRLTITESELSALSDAFVAETRARQRGPAFARRFLLRFFLRRSVIGRGLMAASGSFLTGMNTYLLKLGPENLGAWAGDVDRRIAASFPALATRLRLQDMAELLAEGLSAPLAASPSRPVCLINIAGGPAADSLNALILLQRQHPAALDRRVVVAVLDPDEHGPAFGSRALEALRAPGAPLNGLDIGWRRIDYRWSDQTALRAILEQLRAADCVCAVSSEGGLFEYGSDEEIAANLETIRAGTPAGTIVVGSVTRQGDLVRLTQGANRVATRPRTRAAFERIVERAGWKADAVRERPFSYHVRLSSRQP